MLVSTSISCGEIGASAVADTSDVSTRAGAQTLIDAAVEKFGRIDALINNAGIIRWAGPPDVDEENLRAHLDVHLVWSFNTALAAWPHMVEQGYGRIVLTTCAFNVTCPRRDSTVVQSPVRMPRRWASWGCISTAANCTLRSRSMPRWCTR